MKKHTKREIEKMFFAYKIEYNRLEERNAFLEDENMKLAEKITALKNENAKLSSQLAPIIKFSQLKDKIKQLF